MLIHAGNVSRRWLLIATAVALVVGAVGLLAFGVVRLDDPRGKRQDVPNVDRIPANTLSATSHGRVVAEWVAAEQPVLSIVGAYSLGFRHLTLLRHARRGMAPGHESAGASPEALGEQFELLRAMDVFLTSDVHAVACNDLDPAGEIWLLQGRDPAAVTGDWIHMLAPVILDVQHPRFRDTNVLVCDMSTLPGVNVHLDRIATGAHLEIDVWLPEGESSSLMPRISSRLECSAHCKLRILGSPRTTLSIMACDGPFALPVYLQPVEAAAQLVIPSDAVLDVPVAVSPVGELVVRRDRVGPLPPTRIGRSMAELEVAEARFRHGLVSLSSIRAGGYSRILVWPDGEALCSIPIDSLTHDESGTVYVDLPGPEPAWIEVLPGHAGPPPGWQLFGRPASREHSGVLAQESGGRWVLGPLAPGSWNLHWRRRERPLFVPAILNLEVQPGTRTEVHCAFDLPVPTTVRFHDWGEIPVADRPVSVLLGGMSCKAVSGRPGTFEVEFPPSRRAGAEVVLVFPGIGGAVTVPADHWVGSELLVSIPRVDTIRVSVVPHHGGTIGVRTYIAVPWPDGPPFLLPREHRAATDGSFQFLVGQEHACAAIELLPSGAEVFRGFFSVRGTAREHTVVLPGRWVEVVASVASSALMHARLPGGLEWLVEIPSGASRLWLPASVDAVEFRTRRSVRTYSCAKIADVVIL